MDKATASAPKFAGCSARITRARAKALDVQVVEMQKPPRLGEKRLLLPNCKRAASDENKPEAVTIASSQNKKRAALKDVSNVVHGVSYEAASISLKVKARTTKSGHIRINSKAALGVPKEVDKTISKQKISKVVSIATAEAHQPVSSLKGYIASDTSKLGGHSQDLILPVNLEEPSLIPCKGGTISSRECPVPAPALVGEISCQPAHIENLQKIYACGKSENSKDPHIIYIDSANKDPLACSQYAPDIYHYKHIAELNQRPSTDYMETVQQDITKSMRGILIDWLVEVSEQYKLVPDTLYLTVNLIDRFLSQNYLEKNRLQLLGVTCMLIASKYEEMCAPPVEEFCLITDNTYTRDEVLRMELSVVKFLCYQLSVPTTKTFLRRFIKAAQVTYKVSSLDLEYLANYLAELTLIEYSFRKYLPSLIAASAVFLAGWTLDQSTHPWNPTLEYYTGYKTPDLKVVVTALQDLQLNTNSCPLNAIREKYQQRKFNCVAILSSPRPIQSLS